MKGLTAEFCLQKFEVEENSAFERRIILRLSYNILAERPFSTGMSFIPFVF